MKIIGWVKQNFLILDCTELEGETLDDRARNKTVSEVFLVSGESKQDTFNMNEASTLPYQVSDYISFQVATWLSNACLCKYKYYVDFLALFSSPRSVDLFHALHTLRNKIQHCLFTILRLAPQCHSRE